MDKESILNEIFDNDPLGLLKVKAKTSNGKTADERLLGSFEEINAFVEANNCEPEATMQNISEFQLYTRLKNLREDAEKSTILKPHDRFNPENSSPEDFYFLVLILALQIRKLMRI